mmetsp:Transcript_37109/g.67619  ORF Transcript_37109/g.67619 Transcript_37109/m.67619 type:complete len:351 (+) Transcript_37109:63-1115(+)
MQWLLMVKNTFIDGAYSETDVQTVLIQRILSDPQEYCKTQQGSGAQQQVSDSANHTDIPIESIVEFNLEDEPVEDKAVESADNCIISGQCDVEISSTDDSQAEDNLKQPINVGSDVLKAGFAEEEPCKSPPSTTRSISTRCPTPPEPAMAVDEACMLSHATEEQQPPRQEDEDVQQPRRHENEEAIKSVPNSRSGAMEEEKEWTTVMIRNLPNNMTRDSLAQLLAMRRCDQYDFLYLPCDLHRLNGLGYAFVNFVTHGHAEKAKAQLEGYKSWKDVGESFRSDKICSVAWGRADQQGLQWQIDHYHNSPLMHEKVPDKCRPALFRQGDRVNFPPPTKRLRPPRLKTCKPK